MLVDIAEDHVCRGLQMDLEVIFVAFGLWPKPINPYTRLSALPRAGVRIKAHGAAAR